MKSWDVVHARIISSLQQRPFNGASSLRRHNSNSVVSSAAAHYSIRSFVRRSTRSQHQHSLQNSIDERRKLMSSSSVNAFIRPIRRAESGGNRLGSYYYRGRQQHQQQSSEYKNKPLWKQSNIPVGALVASVTTATILYNDSNKKEVMRNSYISNSRIMMTLCNTIDPNNNHNIQNPDDDVATSPLVSIRNGETEPSLKLLQRPLLFSPKCLEYDHYSGVTIDLERINDDDDANKEESCDGSFSFAERLKQQLQIWKTEGIIRGVWIHVPPQLAAYIPTCIENGFDFHMVTPSTTTANDSDLKSYSKAVDGNTTTTVNNNVLILSQWLPDSESRLPVGPTHQVGVGCLIWHPNDSPMLGPQRRLLVVQEKSGPAATFRLWKLPTGLADPNEDIHDAAIRELYEETGLVGQFVGLLLARQAHPNIVVTTTSPSPSKSTTTDVSNEDLNKRCPKKSSVQRKISDLFFICQLTLPQQQPEQLQSDLSYVNNNAPIWTACPNEIAAIQWMPVQDYCEQQRWQSSPLYMELNRVILESASTSTRTSETPSNNAATLLLWNDTTLPVWLDSNGTTMQQENKDKVLPVYTNTFYSVK